MQTQYASPKLLLEFYKGEKVPPLVKKYDFQSNADESVIKSRNFSAHSNVSVNTQIVDSTKVNVNQLVQMKLQLEKQLSENRELRMIIKQLQENLQRLTSVNDELTKRIQELQKKIVNLTDKSDTLRRQIIRKTRIQIYKEIEDYLKISSQKFLQSIKNSKTKMNPILQNKIQEYLQEVLNINSLSVRKSLNQINNNKTKSFDELQVDKTIKQIVQKRSKQKSISKQRQEESNQYTAIFDRLNRQNQQFKLNLRKEQINSSPNWITDSKSRRPKIFSKSNKKNSRSISREHQTKLDF